MFRVDSLQIEDNENEFDAEFDENDLLENMNDLRISEVMNNYERQKTNNGKM